MIEQFTAFRSSDGSVHDTAHAAWKREFHQWLRASGVDNDAIAAAIIKRMDEGRPETMASLLAIVTGLIETAPPAPPKAPQPDVVAPDNVAVESAACAVASFSSRAGIQLEG